MFTGTALLLNRTTPAPLTLQREIVALLRGPMAAPSIFYGTQDWLRLGYWHTPVLKAIPNVQDAQVNDFGTQQSGSFPVDIPAGLGVDLAAVAATLKGQPVDLDLITRVTRTDGSRTDFITERRGVVKSITRKRDGMTLNIVDIDMAVRQTQFPLDTYTTADWPDMYVDHVNRAIAQGVGIGEKIPCTYVDNGVNKWCACAVPAGMATPTVLAVYRGKQVGQGRVVPTSEYTVGTETRGSGITYVKITFTREQRDFDNSLYVIEADISAPGPQAPADELKRVLSLLGMTADIADFNDAATYQYSVGIKIDAWYPAQRSAGTIIDMLNMAGRMWLSASVAGAYTVFCDKPRSATHMLYDESDQVQINERLDPEVPKTITLRAYPKVGEREYRNDLSRTTSGSAGEKIVTNDFIRDAVVADGLLDYLTKKEQRPRVKGTVCGIKLDAGQRIAVNSPLVLDGWATLDAKSIQRVPDGADVEFEQPGASDYNYTAGTIPANASNGYQPDYSYTPPLAPMSVTVVSQGSGTALSYALIRAVPPAYNWSKLTAQIKNTATGEVYQAQLLLNGINYEATIAGLRPSAAHTVVAWATNANNLDGATLAGAGFTSAALSAANMPTALTVVSQGTSVTAGLGSAFALIRVTPPSGAWATIRAQVTNAVTAEVYQIELLLVGSDYEATVSGLRASQSHNVVAWAINSDGLESALTSPVAFTSAALAAPNTPTALTVVSQASALNVDGTALSYALIRATPPANSWQRMIAQVTLTATGETLQAQLQLVSGNYEVTFTGLRPNVAHTVKVWAVNANSIESAHSATVAFTSAAYGTAPGAPGTPTLTQLIGQSVDVIVTAPTYAGHARCEWQRKYGAGGAWSTITGKESAHFVDTNGLSYGGSFYYRCRFIDRNNNAGAYSAEPSIILSPAVDDNHIIGGGVGTGSLATNAVTSAKITNANVSKGKVKVTYYANSYSVAAGVKQHLIGGSYTVDQRLWSTTDTDFTVNVANFYGVLIGNNIAVTNTAAGARTINFDYYTVDP